MAIDSQPTRPVELVELVDGEGWLTALFDRGTTLDHTATFLGPAPGNWTTAPRIDPQYVVHYLFCAPRARLAVRLERGMVEPPSGALLWFPPGVPYELALHSRRRRERLLRLRFQVRRGERILSPFDDLHVVPRPEGFDCFARELQGEWLVPRPYGGQAVRQLLGRLSVLALRAGPESRGPRGRGPEQVERLAAYVAERVSERPEPADLAAVVGLSPVHFTRVFTATMGCPPRTWLVRERIQHAAERLRTSDKPVHVVAAEYGYDNPFLFSRQFTQVMGSSPSAWRRSS